jgi:hypothetical protein
MNSSKDVGQEMNKQSITFVEKIEASSLKMSYFLNFETNKN